MPLPRCPVRLRRSGIRLHIASLQMVTRPDDRGKLEIPARRMRQHKFIWAKCDRRTIGARLFLRGCIPTITRSRRLIRRLSAYGRSRALLLLAALGYAGVVAVIGELDAKVDRHQRLAAALAIDPAQRRDVGVVASDRDHDMASI